VSSKNVTIQISVFVSGRQELYFNVGWVTFVVRSGVSYCATRAMHADGCSRDRPDLECNKNSRTFINFAIHTDPNLLGQCTNPVSKLTKSFLVWFSATSDLKLLVICFR
jgi:hypothetical protein